MANVLLDFVMSLVRDPDAAAQYAADPAQAIANANLADVTSVDVNHLIPVVAESMSSQMTGADTVVDGAHNVWASGAATAAFDAFDDHLPIQGGDVVADHVPTLASVVEQPMDAAPTIVDHGFDDFSVPSSPTPSEPEPAFEDFLPSDAVAVDDSIVDDHHLDHPQDPGFDIFS